MIGIRRDVPEIGAHQVLLRGHAAARFFQRHILDPGLFVPADAAQASVLLDPGRTEDLVCDDLLTLSATEIAAVTTEVYGISPEEACDRLGSTSEALGVIAVCGWLPPEEVESTIATTDGLKSHLIQKFTTL